MKNKNLLQIFIQAGLLICLAGCSAIAGVMPGGSTSQVLESKMARAEVSVAAGNDLDQLTAGNRAFALDLYHRLETRDGNLFYSPYSISAAVAMTYAGAEGETAEEMADVFHFLVEEERLHPAFNALDLYLESLAEQEIPEDMGEAFQLNIANAIWGQKDFHFESDFLDTLAANYGAGLRLLDYVMEPEKSRIKINNWVSDQTKERIQDLIPQGAINSDTRLVLSNAIYFKATWLEPFEESLTEDGFFYGLDGQKITTQMMSLSSDNSFPYYQGEDFQAVELPYLGGQVSMLVLMPEQGQFSGFEESLNTEMLDQIIGNLAYQPMYLNFPKFKFETEISLANILAEMGMPSAFSDAADFSGMTGTRDLFISDVFHKAFVSVDEEGTEAAAATAVLMELTSAPENPIRLVVDHPFLFLIRDTQTNSILFMGRVVKP
ncbi:MAG: serpin family protein [Anaerolineales bacterium]|nr:serpin family protein [Anaerolineales bacterium]